MDGFPLSRVAPGSLTTANSGFGGRGDSRMGAYFRLVFAADRCRNRKVYWVDQALNGKTRLRQVLNLHRKNRQEDKLIAMVPGRLDEALIRLAIAGANRDQWLTGIRWEVYQDFELTKPWIMGRFDHFDLFPIQPDEKLVRQIGVGEVSVDFNPMSWDYDGLLKGHLCPGCHKPGPVDFLVYYPGSVYCTDCRKACDSEGKELSVATTMIKRLLKEIDVGVFPADDLTGRNDLDLAFIDFRATPILCWVIQHVLRGQPVLDCKQIEWLGDGVRENAFMHALSLESIMRMFRASIFPLLAVKALRERYEVFMKRVLGRYKASGRRMPALPGQSQDVVDEMTSRWQTEAEEHANRDLVELSQLHDWLFGEPIKRLGRSQEELTQLIARAERVVDCVSFYPLVIEEMLDVKGEELYNELQAQEGA